MSIHKKILILSFSPLGRDPRVFRQIAFLKEHYQVITAGFTPPLFDGISFYPIKSDIELSIFKKSRRLLFRRFQFFEKAYWLNGTVQDSYKKLKKIKFDLIIANDINTLPLALKLAQRINAKVIIDAHEYTPRDFDDRWSFRVFLQDYWDGICRQFLPHADAMFTVCQGLADEYSRNYDVTCRVLTNTSFFEDLKPEPVNGQNIKMIHHGGLNPSRRLENMIYLMDKLDERFTLDLMLINRDTNHYKRLKHLSQNNNKIRLIEPVPMPLISKTVNAYDIGLFLLWPESFSYKMALPNKFFEFVQGRLALAIWPSPEMAKLVNKFEIGVISDDFSIASMAEKLNALTATDIMGFKGNSHQAANHLCAENNREMLLSIVKDLIG